MFSGTGPCIYPVIVSHITHTYWLSSRVVHVCWEWEELGLIISVLQPFRSSGVILPVGR
jgi:hypothetical protein